MSTPATLVLVRHGESQWIAEGRFQGRGDPPLSELGRRQAAAVGRRLAAPATMPSLPVPSSPPLAIWHSPLLRAAQTAQAIHDAREDDVPLRALETLVEVGQGEWEGLTHDEVRERWPDVLEAWRQNPLDNQAPGGESLRDAAIRARAAREVVLEEAATPTGRGSDSARPWTIVVAHGGLLRLMMLDLLGIEPRHFWSFPMGLTSVSVVDLGGGVARLRAHNLAAHVTALGDAARPVGEAL